MDPDRARTVLRDFSEKKALKRQRGKWENSKEMDFLFLHPAL